MRDAQKGRKSWLERLTSPPEAEDEQPSSAERSPFDQTPFDQGPFDQGPFDQAPFDQGPFDPPTGEQGHGPMPDGFDAFAPPALRKPQEDDAKAEGADRPQDAPPVKAQERSGGKSDRGQTKGFEAKGFDRTDEHPSGPQSQAPQSQAPQGQAPQSQAPQTGHAREPWEIPVPGLGVPRSSQAAPPSAPGTATAPRPPSASSPGVPSPGAPSEPSGGPSSGSRPGPSSVSGPGPTFAPNDSGPIPLAKPGASAPAKPPKTSDPAPAPGPASPPGPSSAPKPAPGSGIRDRMDDEPHLTGTSAPSPWPSESEDINDMPSLGESRRLSHDSSHDMKLPDEAVPMPVGPSEDDQREAARKRHIEELQHRWLVTQAQLLDDPRDAVREAGMLIGDAMQFVTTTFTEHRDQIEHDWKRESELSTDELRIVMRRYRNLFQYVLSASQLPDL